MLKSNYENKIKNLLDDENIYKKIDMDPTKDLNKRAKSLIEEMVNFNIIEVNQSKKMYNRNAIAPRYSFTPYSK